MIVYIIILTAPELGDLVSALTDLPANKILPFALALKIPEVTVTTAESNFSKDADRVKMESLKWWLRNSDNISWVAIAIALASKAVAEKNLARKILRDNNLEQYISQIGELAVNATFLGPERGQCTFHPPPKKLAIYPPPPRV